MFVHTDDMVVPINWNPGTTSPSQPNFPPSFLL